MDNTNLNHSERKWLIMIVDDNPEFLNGLELTLQMENFDVWTCYNGQQALDELFKAFQTQSGQDSKFDRLPDLIMADIMMPVMDGYELYENARKNPYLNHIPFIFLTAKDADTDIRYGKKLGSDDYLTKLSSTEDILASIQGKLKRIEQRRAIVKQFTPEDDNSFENRTLILAIVVVFLVIIVCGGFFFFTYLGG